jgi:hypothetical protein
MDSSSSTIMVPCKMLHLTTQEGKIGIERDRRIRAEKSYRNSAVNQNLPPQVWTQVCMSDKPCCGRGFGPCTVEVLHSQLMKMDKRWMSFKTEGTGYRYPGTNDDFYNVIIVAESSPEFAELNRTLTRLERGVDPVTFFVEETQFVFNMSGSISRRPRHCHVAIIGDVELGDSDDDDDASEAGGAAEAEEAGGGDDSDVESLTKAIAKSTFAVSKP